ncbi:MAG TPA: FtsX-like permease family protein [bacterium]|nr:FtsX-like permease family protein [bacterium]
MNLKESILIALDALRTNKLRSVLTTLGIVIGVMTVIGMMTIIEGINASVREQFEQIGTNTFYISKYPAVQTGHTRELYRNRKDLTVDQAMAVKRRGTLVQSVSPEMMTWGQRIRYGSEKTNADVLVMGGSEDWQRVNSFFVESGRFFTPMDVQSARRVCVIGKDIVESLFPFKDPIGEEVRIGPDRFRIIGVFEEQGSIFGQSQDNLVTIPYTAFSRVFGQRRNVRISVQAIDPQYLDAAIDEVTGILRRERKVPPGKPNDFEIMTRDSLSETFRNLTAVVFASAVGIAGISLLVGGIGIMNIMLVSVTERTREIGIRKSIGAKRRDILWQFIVEAVALSALGGLIGVLLGTGLGILIGAVTPLPASVPIWAVFVGLLFSSGVGLFFGIFPAGKAAKLDPVVALRYE